VASRSVESPSGVAFLEAAEQTLRMEMGQEKARRGVHAWPAPSELGFSRRAVQRHSKLADIVESSKCQTVMLLLAWRRGCRT
jgi:hypothetical protein